MKPNLKNLEKVLVYQFNQPDLLKLALTHRSHSSKNNERLEFLGDSILNFTIAAALFEQFPQAKEGQMSRLRAQLVKGATLAEVAKEFSLGNYLFLGTGEMKSGGFRRESILADALEAIIGAIYLDAGLATATQWVNQVFAQRLSQLSLTNNQKDAKTRLQEYLQARQLALPVYEVIATVGEAHAQTFTVECQVDQLNFNPKGVGSSRRFAEQAAAEKALTALNVKTE